MKEKKCMDALSETFESTESHHSPLYKKEDATYTGTYNIAYNFL